MAAHALPRFVSRHFWSLLSICRLEASLPARTLLSRASTLTHASDALTCQVTSLSGSHCAQTVHSLMQMPVLSFAWTTLIHIPRLLQAARPMSSARSYTPIHDCPSSRVPHNAMPAMEIYVLGRNAREHVLRAKVR